MPTAPDLNALVQALSAHAMALERPVPDLISLQSFLRRALFHHVAGDGQEVWVCFVAGLITEIEARNLLMARASTWLTQSVDGSTASVAEIQDALPELELAYDLGLYGRRAKPVAGVDG